MKLKKVLLIVALAGLFCGNTMFVSAQINKESYANEYVKKLTDYRSGYLEKVNAYDDASNRVSKVEGNRNLCCWVENWLGNKFSNKVSYNTATTIYMQYTHPGELGTARLAVSTVLTNFQKTQTSGTWSPDYIQ